MTAQSQITNLGELRAAVADWVDRTDLDTVIQSYPALVEGDLHSRMIDGEPFRHWRMISAPEDDGTIAIEADNPLVELPPDWLETIDARRDGREVLYKSPDFIEAHREYYINGTEPDEPYFFTYRGPYIELWPTPTADGTLSLEYYQKIPAMSATGDTNWLLTNYPNVYLHGCLMYTATYLRDDERIALWSRLYEDSITGLFYESKRARHSGSRLNRPQPVTF